VPVQPASASSSWTDGVLPWGVAGGAGAVVFAGLSAAWFRRRRSAVARQAPATTDSDDSPNAG
jgi:hypothetical protein